MEGGFIKRNVRRCLSLSGNRYGKKLQYANFMCLYAVVQVVPIMDRTDTRQPIARPSIA